MDSGRSHETVPEREVIALVAARGLDRRLPPQTPVTVLVDSYPAQTKFEPAVQELTQWLEASGHRVYYEDVDLGPQGRWRRVLAGTYDDHEYETASWDAARLKAAAPVLEARVLVRHATPPGR